MDLMLTLFGFWIYVFSPSFRAALKHEFEKAGLFFKLIIIIEMLVSTVAGLLLPAFVIFTFYFPTQLAI